MNIHDDLTCQNVIYRGLKCARGRRARTRYTCIPRFATFLICTSRAVTRYLRATRISHRIAHPPLAPPLNLYTILPALSVEYLLGFSFGDTYIIYRQQFAI